MGYIISVLSIGGLMLSFFYHCDNISIAVGVAVVGLVTIGYVITDYYLTFVEREAKKWER